MGEGTGQPDKQPRPNDATVIGGDATVIGGEAGGMPAGPMPETIAGYAIKGAIGAGGMGSVYLAQQESPKRDVAIKVMNAGAVSRKAMRRFEFEAQTLGKLQHPAIAQIYEAGTYDDGSGARPFFAMEYVAGAKELNDYVGDNDIDQRTRLELFCAACEGVEYGHRRGVIHRDLKPGNILVDEDGNPKIIDFGVARSTDSDSVSATLATEAGQLIGTLQYMSPEQVELDPGELDTRSDVYALGVMLYELLVDRLPYDLTGTSLTQAASRIREIQPRRLGEINATLKGDLETICLKALEKDREQRYQTVNDLAEDVRRYLADEPIMARPPTRAEQVRRFVRKNKAASVATCVVALALVAATTISVVFAVEAGRQRDQASQQRDAAEQARQEANTQRDAAKTAGKEARRQQIIAEVVAGRLQEQAEDMQVMVDFQAEQLSSIDVTEMGESLRQEMLQELKLEATDTEEVDFTGASVRLLDTHIFKPTLESLNTRYVDQPLVQAQLLQALSRSLKSIGLLAEAMGPQTRALKLRTEHLGREHELTLVSIRRMADLLWSSGNFDQVLPYEEELLEIRRRINGNDHPKTLDEMEDVADTLEVLKRYEEAEQYRLELLELSRRKWGDEHRRTLNEMERLGELYMELDEYEKAFPYFRSALETRQRIWGDEDSDTLSSMEAMGELLEDQRKYEEAAPYFKHVLEVRRRTLGNEHGYTLLAIGDVADLLWAQGKFERDGDKVDEALALFRDILDVHRRVNGNMHPTTLVYIQGLALRIDGLGIDEEAALELYIESLEGYRSVGGDDDPRVLALLAEIADHLFDDLERYDEVELYLEELIPLQRRILGNDHSDTFDSITLMSRTLYRQNKYDEAEPYYVERLSLSRRLHGNDDPATLYVMNMMGRILRIQGKYDEAEAHYIECIDARRRTLGDDNPDTLTTISNLAYLLMKQERYDEAVPIQLEVLVGRRRVLGEAHTSSISSLKRVISLFKALHRAKSGAGYDRIAAKYQSQLDAIEAEKANEPEPAAP